MAATRSHSFLVCSPCTKVLLFVLQATRGSNTELRAAARVQMRDGGHGLGRERQSVQWDLLVWLLSFYMDNLHNQ